nr:carboxymuconolactone decarboxylase family protein [uncultured Tolumonas sp.]
MEQRVNFFKANPETMKHMNSLEQRVVSSGFELSLIELVKLRVSQINGCAYCIDMHSAAARKLGESERRLSVLSVWKDTPFFTERERAALQWAELVTLISESHVTEERWNDISSYFTEAEIVDLTFIITTTNAWNRFAIAFRKLPN